MNNTVGACPRCGENIIRETFMRIDCINPDCKFFHQSYFNEVLGIGSKPHWRDIRDFGYEDPTFLGGCWWNKEYFDLWRATYADIELYVTRFGYASENEFATDVRLVDDQSSPIYQETQKRWQYLQRHQINKIENRAA